jgi:hypothetical protein
MRVGGRFLHLGARLGNDFAARNPVIRSFIALQLDHHRYVAKPVMLGLKA